MKARCCAVAFLLLSGFAQADLPAWLAPEGLDDPRLGQVLHTSSGEWIGPLELVEHLALAPRVVIGEKHDNPDHHSLQHWLLEQLHGRRSQGALVMEMIGPEQQQQVDHLHGKPLPTDPELIEVLGWGTGWDWAQYGALIRWGLTYPRQLLAANLGREEMLEFYRQPQPLTDVYDDEARARLTEVMDDAHCRKLPQAHLPAMLSIQQARDQRMAQVLGEARAPAILLAGNFHARRDLGMPLHWAGREDSLIIVMLVEAGSDLPDSRQADFVWITAATPERDYCADIQASSALTP